MLLRHELRLKQKTLKQQQPQRLQQIPLDFQSRLPSLLRSRGPSSASPSSMAGPETFVLLRHMWLKNCFLHREEQQKRW
jgi:hypothetical protein